MCMRLFLFAVVFLASVQGRDGWYARRPNQTKQNRENKKSDAIPLSAANLDPMIARLVALNESSKTPEFRQVLKETAETQNWQRELDDYGKLLPLVERAKAVAIKLEDEILVVVLLGSCSPFIPGVDAQMAILLDNHGKHLDYLACEINTRISHGPYRFHAVITDKAENDGAQIVIRLDGQGRNGNFGQTIDHQGKRTQFPLCRELGSLIQPAKWDLKWDKNGLCRVAIKEKKFKVVFPTERDIISEPR